MRYIRCLLTFNFPVLLANEENVREASVGELRETMRAAHEVETTLNQDLYRQKYVNRIFYTNAIRLLKGMMLQGQKQGHANINCETRVPRRTCVQK